MAAPGRRFSILIVGSTGAFGTKIAELLSRGGDLDLILAGRTAASLVVQADALSKSIGRRVRTAVVDANRIGADDLKPLGADLVIDYKTSDWLDAVMAATGKRGVDVVLDMVAGPYVEKNLRALAPDGRYSMIAFLLGAKAEVNFGHVLAKRLTITGSTLRPQPVPAKAAIVRDVEQHVWPLIAAGRYRSPVYRTFPLAEAAAAHALMESSEHMGKIVLTV